MNDYMTFGLTLSTVLAIALIATPWRSRDWSHVTAAGILLANWFIWSAGVLSADDWAPWRLAILLDGGAAALFLSMGRAILAGSAAYLVGLHILFGAGAVGYEPYYYHGLFVGYCQALYVGIRAFASMLRGARMT